jgi:hypothetical protein
MDEVNSDHKFGYLPHGINICVFPTDDPNRFIPRFQCDRTVMPLPLFTMHKFAMGSSSAPSLEVYSPNMVFHVVYS